jgi:hypothetical protein
VLVVAVWGVWGNKAGMSEWCCGVSSVLIGCNHHSTTRAATRVLTVNTSSIMLALFFSGIEVTWTSALVYLFPPVTIFWSRRGRFLPFTILHDAAGARSSFTCLFPSSVWYFSRSALNGGLDRGDYGDGWRRHLLDKAVIGQAKAGKLNANESRLCLGNELLLHFG